MLTIVSVSNICYTYNRGSKSSMNNEVIFRINKIRNIDNGNRYNIEIGISINMGWIDYLDFVIEMGNDKKVYSMDYVKNENDRSVFKVDVDLNTRALYHYYFVCKINNQIKYIKRNNIISDYIEKDEMFKMSVNFEVPDWAKGKMMYHISSKWNKCSTWMWSNCTTY